MCRSCDGIVSDTDALMICKVNRDIENDAETWQRYSFDPPPSRFPVKPSASRRRRICSPSSDSYLTEVRMTIGISCTTGRPAVLGMAVVLPRGVHGSAVGLSTGVLWWRRRSTSILSSLPLTTLGRRSMGKRLRRRWGGIPAWCGRFFIRIRPHGTPDPTIVPPLPFSTLGPWLGTELRSSRVRLSKGRRRLSRGESVRVLPNVHTWRAPFVIVS